MDRPLSYPVLQDEMAMTTSLETFLSLSHLYS
jgi:hypothetical protein